MLAQIITTENFKENKIIVTLVPDGWSFSIAAHHVALSNARNEWPVALRMAALIVSALLSARHREVASKEGLESIALR